MIFLRHCMETFLVRTNPASSMANPAAIHMTRKPPIRKANVLKIFCVARSGSGTIVESCASASIGNAVIAIAPPIIFANLRIGFPFLKTIRRLALARDVMARESLGRRSYESDSQVHFMCENNSNLLYCCAQDMKRTQCAMP